MANNQTGRYEYHHTNALGSNIVLTDDNKNVLVRYEYDVFGAVRSEVGTSDNSRKFTGKEYESDVKLYYFAARYYDPYIGRFTQRDPVGDGKNWYAYAFNNPLSYTDPTGKVPVKDQPGSVDGFIEEFFPEPEMEGEATSHPQLSDFGFTNTGSYDYQPGNMQGKINSSKNRYIHTEKYGWIDMKHFMTAAAIAADRWQRYRSRHIGYNYAINMGELVEIDQLTSGDKTVRQSGFSYEDLPSNDAGATFGAYNYNPYKRLGDQIKAFLDAQNPTADPTAVKNYSRLADTNANIGPSHIHRNFTYRPFDLNKLRRN